MPQIKEANAQFDVQTASQLYRALADSFAQKLLTALNGSITSLVLYGSVARGRARPESDVDIFVVAGKTEVETESLWNQIFDLEQDFWNTVDTVMLREQGYRASIETYVVSEAQAQRGLPIYLDMALEAVVLHDTNSFFAQRLEQVRQRMALLKSHRDWVDNEGYLWQIKEGAKPGEVIALPYIEEVGV